MIFYKGLHCSYNMKIQPCNASLNLSNSWFSSFFHNTVSELCWFCVVPSFPYLKTSDVNKLNRGSQLKLEQTFCLTQNFQVFGHKEILSSYHGGFTFFTRFYNIIQDLKLMHFFRLHGSCQYICQILYRGRTGRGLIQIYLQCYLNTETILK